MSDESPQSKGGRIRAQRLSGENRRVIAQNAARARWDSIRLNKDGDIPKAVATGILRIGNIPCAVLDNAENTRVLTQAGFLTAIGRTRTPTGAGDRFADLPPFLRSMNLQPFVSKDLIVSSKPIIFDTESVDASGRRFVNRAWGYRAQLLPDVCWVYAKAQMAGKLKVRQRHIADVCTRLLEALTNLAIDALIDEATGFQDIRAKDALIKLLERYVSRDALPWVKTFDDDFYKEMFRLHGYSYNPDSIKRPMLFAKRTEDIYNRLAPGVRQQLQQVVKRGPSGRPKDKLFQHLTENEGYRRLVELLAGVKAIMKLSNGVNDYHQKLDRVFPRFGDTLQIPFPESERTS